MKGLLVGIIILIVCVVGWTFIENVYTNKIKCEEMGGKLGLNWNVCRMDGYIRDISSSSFENDGRWTLFKNNGRDGVSDVEQMIKKTQEKFG